MRSIVDAQAISRSRLWPSMYRLKLGPCAGPREERVVGAAIEDLGKAGDQVATIPELYQPFATTNGLPQRTLFH